MALDNDILIHVAPATPGAVPPLDKMRVFHVPQADHLNGRMHVAVGDGDQGGGLVVGLGDEAVVVAFGDDGGADGFVA